MQRAPCLCLWLRQLQRLCGVKWHWACSRLKAAVLRGSGRRSERRASPAGDHDQRPNGKAGYPVRGSFARVRRHRNGHDGADSCLSARQQADVLTFGAARVRQFLNALSFARVK